jgi:hypothetical protein
VYDNEFHDYPTIQRTRGDCQAITIAASRYGTNLRKVGGVLFRTPGSRNRPEQKYPALFRAAMPLLMLAVAQGAS